MSDDRYARDRAEARGMAVRAVTQKYGADVADDVAALIDAEDLFFVHLPTSRRRALDSIREAVARCREIDRRRGES